MRFWHKKQYTMITRENAELVANAVRKAVIELDGDLAEVGVNVGDTAEVICENKGVRSLH